MTWNNNHFLSLRFGDWQCELGIARLFFWSETVSRWSWLGSDTHLPLASGLFGAGWFVGLVVGRWDDWGHSPPWSLVLRQAWACLHGSWRRPRTSIKKATWASSFQVSACTCLQMFSSTEASPVTSAASQGGEINDADLSAGRAVRSHCNRAWIKEGNILWPFLQFTATNSKMRTLCWNNGRITRTYELKAPLIEKCLFIDF